MNTIAVLRRWVERESVGKVADGIGVDRQTVSRHINGHLPISAKHLTAYLESAPPDLRYDFLGAWLLDHIPPELHAELLHADGAPRSEVARFTAAPDPALMRRIEFLAQEATTDAELRRVLLSLTDWMGFEEPPAPAPPTGGVRYNPKVKPFLVSEIELSSE